MIFHRVFWVWGFFCLFVLFCGGFFFGGVVLGFLFCYFGLGVFGGLLGESIFFVGFFLLFCGGGI